MTGLINCLRKVNYNDVCLFTVF